MNSLLKKSNYNEKDYSKLEIIKNEYDREILLELNNFETVLNNAFNSKSLNEITDYLFRLTNVYNRFYAENKILTESDEQIKKSWLYLTKCVYDINNILLNILAIDIPDKI